MEIPINAQMEKTNRFPSFFEVTWSVSPNGGHVFSPEKVTAMGPNEVTT